VNGEIVDELEWKGFIGVGCHWVELPVSPRCRAEPAGRFQADITSDAQMSIQHKFWSDILIIVEKKSRFSPIETSQ
jgi:hypothetical protein